VAGYVDLIMCMLVFSNILLTLRMASICSSSALCCSDLGKLGLELRSWGPPLWIKTRLTCTCMSCMCVWTHINVYMYAHIHTYTHRCMYVIAHLWAFWALDFVDHVVHRHTSDSQAIDGENDVSYMHLSCIHVCVCARTYLCMHVSVTDRPLMAKRMSPTCTCHVFMCVCARFFVYACISDCRIMSCKTDESCCMHFTCTYLCMCLFCVCLCVYACTKWHQFHVWRRKHPECSLGMYAPPNISTYDR
jgi:hypothetical protein